MEVGTRGIGIMRSDSSNYLIGRAIEENRLPFDLLLRLVLLLLLMYSDMGDVSLDEAVCPCPSGGLQANPVVHSLDGMG